MRQYRLNKGLIRNVIMLPLKRTPLIFYLFLFHLLIIYLFIYLFIYYHYLIIYFLLIIIIFFFFLGGGDNEIEITVETIMLLHTLLNHGYP